MKDLSESQEKAQLLPQKIREYKQMQISDNSWV
nr:MAG TPA: hypothetical protein [Bacteriophage sp.]